MTEILETRRLRLREFRPHDLDKLAAMVGDEEQMQFYPRARTRGEARAWIVRNLSLYKENRFGFWLIESRPSSVFLGYCGIRPLVLQSAPATEIGWHTKKTSWNQGIATEAAAAVRDRRVAEKIGMRDEGPITYDGDPYATYVSEHA